MWTAGATGWRLAAALLLATAAACLPQGGDAPPLPASGRHRVQASGAAADALLLRGATLVADYGAFRILDATPADLERLPPGASVEYRNDYLRLSLNSGDLDTSLPQPLETAGGAARQGKTSLRSDAVGAAGKALHLVQFAGPVRPEWLARLESTGARVVSYAPANGYLLYGDAAALEALGPLRATHEVQFDAPYLPAHKLDRALALEDTGSYAVQLVDDPDVNAETLDLVRRLEHRPGTVSSALGFVNLVVHADRAAAEVIAARPDVVSVQPWSPPRLLDERQDMIVAGQLVGGLPTGPGYLAWLASKGFTQEQFEASGFGVDVSDSGVDAGTTLPNHFALYRLGDVAGESRVSYARLEGTGHLGGTLEGCDGHGTLNAHIIAGYSDLSGVHADLEGYRYGLGVAPFVRIGSSVVFDPNTFTSPDYEDLISRAYADGMRISSNSWGESVSAYTFDCQRYDALVRDAAPDGSAVPQAGNQEMVIVFAAGNSGAAGAGSIGAPGNAKNVISVGAAENVRAFGGPDRCSFPDTMADSALDVATFSSRGPAADGRVRPDLLAPGTHVTGGVAQAPEQRASPPASATGLQLACYSGQTVCGGVGSAYFPSGQLWYTASSGTSHATPAVAGAAALVRQWFLNEGRPPPSPAMTKAVLMNAARYMSGVGANDTLFSNAQGMGLVDLGALFDGAPRLLRDQEPDDLFTATGQARVFTSAVADPTRPFRVTLAWTDAPGATFAAAYKNDLDLTVDVGGATYKGNVFAGPASVPGGVADARNNVESVFLPAGTAGTYTVTVTAASINSDGVPGNASPLDQDFALVVGNGCATPTPAAPAGVAVSAAAENTLVVSWTPNGAADYLVYRSTLPGGPQELVATVPAPPLVDAGRSGGVTYAYVVRARQGCALSAPSATVSATPAGACLLSPAFAGLASVATTGAAVCGNALAWAPARPSCAGTISYDVFRSTAAGFVPGLANRIATGVQATTFVDGSLVGGTTYHYVVRAVETTAQAAVADGNTVQRSAAPFLVTVPVRDDFDLNRPATPSAWWIEQLLSGPDSLSLVSGCRWHSSSTAYRFGQALPACGGTYQNNTQAQLVLGGDGTASPIVNGISIPPGGRATLTFRVAYQLDNGSDGVYLAYSTTGAAGTYAPIPDTVTEGLPYVASGGYDAPIASVGSRRGWTGSALPPNGALREVVVNLDALAGQTVWLGWRFGTDATGVVEGFYLDDVRLEIRDPACSSCATAPPPAPTGVAAAATAANEVTVTWTPGGASSYEVYRSEAAGGAWVLAGAASAPPFVDLGRSAGVTYHYVVHARQGCALSSPSAEATVTATGACLLAPAFAGLAAAGTTGAATCGNALAWPAATPACGGTVTYDVFRGTTTGFTPGSGNRIATGVTATEYVDTADLAGGTPYFYVVRAVETSATGTISDGNAVERSATPALVSVSFADDFDSSRPPNPDAWWLEQVQLGTDQLQIVKGCRWQSADTAYRFGQTAATCGGTYPFSTVNQLVLGGNGSAGANGFAIPADARGTLAFRLWYRLEGFFDGATLTYSTAGAAGPFAQVPDVPSTTAPYITSGGYDGFVSAYPQAGSTRGWTGLTGGNLPTGGLKQVVVNLDALAGRTVWFGWRIASDTTTGGPVPEGLFLDDVTVDARSSACTTASTQPGAAVRFALSGLPAAVTADQATTVTMTALDASGRTATAYSGRAALTSSDALAVLPAPVTFAGGVAIATVRFRTAGTQTLTVTDTTTPTLTGAGSTAVAAGAPLALRFAVEPSAGVAGQPLSPAPRVELLDAFGNLTASTASVSVSLASGPNGAALSGTTLVPAAGGTATFGDLSLDVAGAGYTLLASSGTLASATTGAFTVAPGPVARLAVAGPADATAGVQVTYSLQALDAFSNAVTSHAGSASATSSDPAALLPPSVPFTAGQATAAVTFRTAGARTLTFTEAGGTVSGSVAVTVSPGAATRIVVTGLPATVTADAAATLTLTAQDAFGQTATGYSGPAVLASTDAAAVLPATPVSFTSGVASATIRLRTAGPQTVTATDTGSATITGSASATVAPAAAAALRFVAQPPSGTAGQALSPAPSVELLDAFGNRAASTASVTMTLAANPPGGTLSGTVTVTAVAGLATFPNLLLDRSGGGYTLRASSGTLPPATSNAFAVAAGPVTRYAVSGPAAATAGVQVSYTLQALDAFSNLATSYAGTANATSTDPAATLPAGVVFAAGQATAAVTFRTSGAQTLTFAETAGAATGAISVTVSPSSAVRYTVAGLPATLTAGSTATVTLTALDAFGQVATGYAGQAVLSSSDAAAVLPATPVAFTAGVATATIGLRTAGAQTLRAVDAGNPAVEGSASTSVVAGAATTLRFVAQPPSGVAGQALSPAPSVEIVDVFGNRTASTASLLLSVATGPDGATLSGTTFVPAAAGIATFPAVALDRAGPGYTLLASSGTLASATSAAFAITAGPVTRYAVSGPAAATAGVQVSYALQALDAFSNLATSYAGTANATSSDPAALLPPSVTFTSGQATADVTFRTAGARTLTFTEAGGTVSGSAAVTVSPGAATRIVVTGLPANVTADAATTVTLTAQDAFGQTATGYSGPAVLASTDAAAVLPATPVSFTSGVASATVRLRTAGPQTVTATDTGSATITGSASTTVAPAAAASLRFVAQPSSGTAGQALSPAPSVELLDAFGNRAASTASVTMTLAANPAGGTLSGTLTVSAVAGVATFPNLLLDRSGGGYTLRASSGTLPPATSNAFAVAAGPVTRYAVSGPAAPTAGVQVSFALQALDAFSNLATSYAGSASVTSTDPAATLPGSVVFAAGQATAAATFRTAGAQTLTFADSAGAAAGAISVTVSPASAVRYTMAGLPATLTAGSTATVTLTALDAFDQLAAGYAGQAVLSSSDSAALLPAKPVAFAGGVATATVELRTAGAQTLRAVDAGNPAVEGSASTSVAPAAPAALRFVAQPSSGEAGQALSPAPSVEIVDAFGNRTASTASVFLSVATGPDGATLSGTTLVPAAAGIATFPAVALDRAGPGYTLLASSGTLTSATSAAFAIAAGPVTHYAVSGPAVATAGVQVSYALQALDAFSNVATSYAGSAFVTSDDSAALLPASVVFAAGQATAAVTFRSAGVRTVTFIEVGGAVSGSAAVTVSPGAATRIVITGLPASVTADAATTLTLTAQDAFGQTATGYAGTATLSSSDAGALLPATPVSFTSGVASATIRLRTAGPQTVTATDTGSATITGSASTTVTPAAAVALRFVVQPPAGVAGQALSPAPSVELLDAFGNRTASAASVTMALAANPTGATLSGTVTVSAAAGLATFPNLLLDRSGNGYTLRATSGTLPAATSAPFAIAAGPVTRYAVSGPSAPTAGVPVSYTLQALDAFSNVATSYAGSAGVTSSDLAATLPASVVFAAGQATAAVTFRTAGAQSLTFAETGGPAGAITVSVSPSGAVRYTVAGLPATATAGSPVTVTLTALDPFGQVATTYAGLAAFSSSDAAAVLPATPVSFTAGVATATVELRTAGAQTLRAADAGNPAIDGSASTTVVAGAPSALRFVAQPSSGTAGQALSPAPSVEIVDAFGNRTTSTASVTMAVATGPEGAALSGTTLLPATDGLATFASVTLDRAGPGYTLLASSGTLASGTSHAFAVVAGAVTHYVVSGPTAAPAGVQASYALQALDAFGNPATSYAGTASVTSTDAAATLPASVVFAAGEASATVVFTTAGSRTLTFAELAGTASGTIAVTVSAAAPARIVITGLPAAVSADAAVAVTLTALDAFGQTATGYSGTATLSSSDAAAVLPTTPVSFANGVSSATIRLRTAGAQTVTATDTASATITGSASTTVAPAAAAALRFSVQPPPGVAGQALFPAPSVEIVDAFGNRTTSTASVTMAVATGPAGATLSGTVTVAAVAGLATFPDLLLDRSASGYTLGAASGTLAAARSAAFAVTAGPAARYAVLGPAAPTAGVPVTYVVQALDASSNPVTTYAGSARLTSSDPAATLPATITFVSGEATASVTFRTAGARTLLAVDEASPAIEGTLSPMVAPAAPAALRFAVQPGAAVAGQVLAPAPAVEVLDAFGNRAATPAQVTLSIASGPSFATLSGTTSEAAVAGLATFPSAWVDKAGSGYALRASSGTLPAATSAPFLAQAGPATRYAVSGPAAALAGAEVTYALEAVDAFSNPATGYAGRASVASSDGAATLPASVTFGAGRASVAVTFRTAGSQTLSLTEAAGDASGTITVTVEAAPPPAGSAGGGGGCGHGSGASGGTLLLALLALLVRARRRDMPAR